VGEGRRLQLLLRREVRREGKGKKRIYTGEVPQAAGPAGEKSLLQRKKRRGAINGGEEGGEKAKCLPFTGTRGEKQKALTILDLGKERRFA